MKYTWTVRSQYKNSKGLLINTCHEFLTREEARKFKPFLRLMRNNTKVNMYKTISVEINNGKCFATYMEKTY